MHLNTAHRKAPQLDGEGTMSENTIGLLRYKDKQVHVAFSQPVRIDGGHLSEGFGSVRAEAIDATLLGHRSTFRRSSLDIIHAHHVADVEFADATAVTHEAESASMRSAERLHAGQ